MDPLLILIFIILVIIIGYILSRPFENPPETRKNPLPETDLENRYQALLREIKALQANATTEDGTATLEKIEAKKQAAAELLRQIKPSLNNDSKS